LQRWFGFGFSFGWNHHSAGVAAYIRFFPRHQQCVAPFLLIPLSSFLLARKMHMLMARVWHGQSRGVEVHGC